MDNRIRLNEKCSIGLPRCDYVFSSTRTCFIAYGFNTSPLELTILKRILESKGIQPIEAGGALAPGQSAFCAKICSKIITSQFCIVLINNDINDGHEVPNANVNMEYGLMLGFNKYVIPFQKESQHLPFNVAGLDTVKYSDRDFERLATNAIDVAIPETSQDSHNQAQGNQKIEAFLISKNYLFTHINEGGDKNLFQIGSPLGFNLLNDFAAMNYTYLGNFTNLRSEIVIWRLKMLNQILAERRSSISERLARKIITDEQATNLDELLRTMQIWVIVTSEDEKIAIQTVLDSTEFSTAVTCYSINDIDSHLGTL